MIDPALQSLILRNMPVTITAVLQIFQQPVELLLFHFDRNNLIGETAHEEGFKAGFAEGYADATEQVQQESLEMLEGMRASIRWCLERGIAI